MIEHRRVECLITLVAVIFLIATDLSASIEWYTDKWIRRGIQWFSKEHVCSFLATTITISNKGGGKQRRIVTVLVDGMLFPRPAARVLIGTPSQFFFVSQDRWTYHHHHHARARWRLCLATSSPMYLYEWNERENTRISRVQESTSSSEAACLWDKRVTRAKAWSAKTSSAKSSYWRNKPESTEATQSLTAARCQQTSVSNSRTKARARTLPWKWNNNQRQVLTQPTTSSMQTMWAKTSTAWTWDPCSQTVDLMWGHFPSC